MLIPYSSLKIIKQIGSGAFGKVYIGEWKQTKVAIKVGLGENDETFIKEAELTINIPPHPNIVQTLGISVQPETNSPVLVLEYCDGGSLDKILFPSTSQEIIITIEEKIEMIKEIARGMLHLHSNNVIHRDLAARNVLISRGQPKISDFGLSRTLTSQLSEGKTNHTVGPLRWMAPESLQTSSYSAKTDVWTFGIVVYEIISRKEPHFDEDQMKVAYLIRDENLTPKIPHDCDSKLKSLMELCWNPDPQNRPDFEKICKILTTSNTK